jgi:hypothetical protein
MTHFQTVHTNFAPQGIIDYICIIQHLEIPTIDFISINISDSVLLASIGGYKWDNNPRHLRPESG